MTNKILLFCATILILSACISSCTSGSKSNSQSLHTYCQGFTLTCQNGGTCGEASLGNNQYDDTCTCPGPYEGVTCETPARNKFIGTYIGVMSQQNPGAATVTTFPDTVTIVANADVTMATVRHLYQFMIPSLQSAAYDSLVLVADQSILVAPDTRTIEVNFTDQGNTQLHFACPGGAYGYGGLFNSWFDGTRQ